MVSTSHIHPLRWERNTPNARHYVKKQGELADFVKNVDDIEKVLERLDEVIGQRMRVYNQEIAGVPREQRNTSARGMRDDFEGLKSICIFRFRRKERSRRSPLG